ncbi:hypothetical protein SORBI_3008G019100 [Sorghum bicolor]|uniref:Uncharacterized protein n=1 Tax=Sorghum bicolor TaxID=4558 RepID=A0A1B6PAQ7_SORBI|nr:hypothetical protein SORBI_3008G019100 [Sorghum bicolor]
MAPSVMATWRRRPPPPSRLHSRGSSPPPEDSPSPAAPPTAKGSAACRTRVADPKHLPAAAIVDGGAAEAAAEDGVPAALQLLGALPPRVQQGRLPGPREQREVARVQRRQTLQKIFYFLTLYISHSIDN